MESSRGGQGGIQLLLAAEQEAQHIVNAARNGNLLCVLCSNEMDISCHFQFYISYL